MTDEFTTPPELLAPLRPAAAPRRRINPFGLFSMISGLIASASATFLFVLTGQAREPRGHVAADIGAVIVFAGGLVVFLAGGLGGLAALFGMVRRPRWQGVIGMILSLGVPAGLFVIAHYR